MRFPAVKPFATYMSPMPNPIVIANFAASQSHISIHLIGGKKGEGNWTRHFPQRCWNCSDPGTVKDLEAPTSLEP